MRREEIIRSLEALGDFDNIDAARVHVDTLTKEMLEADAANPGQTYRVTDDGPEQTVAEILAGFERDEAELRLIRAAVKAFAQNQSGKTQP